MTYTLNWTGNKAPINVPPRSIIADQTSLTLFGQGFPTFGEGLQENLLKLLENFAHTQPPEYPTVGQIWFDTQVGILKACIAIEPAIWEPLKGTPDLTSLPPVLHDGQLWWDTAHGQLKLRVNGQWVIIFPVNFHQVGTDEPLTPNDGELWWDNINKRLYLFNAAAWNLIYPSALNQPTVAVAGPTEYNTLVGVYNQIAGTITGTTVTDAYGYGLTLIPPKLPTDSVSMTEWNNVLTLLRAVAEYQNLPASTIDNIAISQTGYMTTLGVDGNIYSLITELQRTTTQVSALPYTRWNVNPAFLVSNQPFSNPSITEPPIDPSTGSFQQSLVVQYSTAQELYQFFNVGSSLRFGLSFTVPPTTANGILWDAALTNDLLATNFADGNGLVFDALSHSTAGYFTKGYYDMLPSTWQTIFQQPISSGNTILVEARADAAWNRLWLRVTLTFTGVDGMLQGAWRVSYPNDTILNNPLAINISMPSAS